MIGKLVSILFFQSMLFNVTAEAISCFQCNSANNSQCENLEQWGRGRVILPKPCENYNDTVPSFCRKTVLNLLENTKIVSTRVIRSCGYIMHKQKKTCYRTDNDDHLQTVCQCFQDNCNAAFSLRPTSILLFLIFTLKFIIL